SNTISMVNGWTNWPANALQSSPCGNEPRSASPCPNEVVTKLPPRSVALRPAPELSATEPSSSKRASTAASLSNTSVSVCVPHPKLEPLHSYTSAPGTGGEPTCQEPASDGS